MTCGICKMQGGDEVFWFSSISRSVHLGCYNKIKNAESNVTKTIDSLFHDNCDKNEAFAIGTPVNLCSK